MSARMHIRSRASDWILSRSSARALLLADAGARRVRGLLARFTHVLARLGNGIAYTFALVLAYLLAAVVAWALLCMLASITALVYMRPERADRWGIP